jgi:membrane protein YqaA with SNARE-associated domain
MKTLIERALTSLEKPIAMRIFVVVSFLESALLPIPVETLSIPLLTSRPNPWPVAFWGSLSSVLGGVAGYFIGLALFDTLGRWLIELYGVTDQYLALTREASADLSDGSWLIMVGAVTPIPFKLVSIAAGAVQFPFLVFVVVATLGRSLRFTAFAFAFHCFGDRLREIIHRRPTLISTLVVVLLIGGFAILLI